MLSKPLVFIFINIGSSIRVNNNLPSGIIYPVYKSTAASEDTVPSSSFVFPAASPEFRVKSSDQLFRPLRLPGTGTSCKSRPQSRSPSNSWTRPTFVPWVICPGPLDADWSVRAPQRRRDLAALSAAPTRHLRLQRLETGLLIRL